MATYSDNTIMRYVVVVGQRIQTGAGPTLITGIKVWRNKGMCSSDFESTQVSSIFCTSICT